MAANGLLSRVRTDRRLRRGGVALGLLNLIAFVVVVSQLARVGGSWVGDLVFAGAMVVTLVAVWGVEVWLLSIFFQPRN